MNYTEIFTAHLTPRIDAAVRSMNYDMAYTATPPVATIVFDGTAYSPSWRGALTDRQWVNVLSTYTYVTGDDVNLTWSQVIETLSDNLSDEGPEGETYALDEDEGSVFLVRLDADGNLPAGYNA